ncbi:MAG: chloride channel protein [Roseiarcus sp.]|jgi:CIC family chloride channel protein
MRIALSHRLLAAASRLRAIVRTNELSLVVVAIVVGGLAGLGVTAMTGIAETAHVAIYGIPFDVRLSAAARISPVAAFLALPLGGLALGLIGRWRRARKAPPAVDPIEANALRGGHMAMGESALVAAQTVISNGCGASVGLESGYAQIGAAIASRIGLALRLRRQDLRLLVGCGAGGAIAGAFGAPLTGAFYASELIIGAYSLANAGPIFAAALAATLTTKALLGAPYVIVAPPVAPLAIGHHLVLVGLGLISAALGVGAMRAAAVLERAFAATRAPQWARPVLGGLVLAAMALYTPQTLGAGHGAVGLDFSAPLSAATLATLLALKLSASLVSLASGFRGGLFFASLFAGALLGKLYALGVAAALPALALDPTACIMAGMGTLSVAVVGGPLTMTFLVLESTGDLSVAGGVLAASIATSLAVRATFGYSFTTWRLHLRGESIRGAQDIGWLRDLTVARLMVRSPPTTPAQASVRAFRAAYPLGSAHVVVAVDEAGRYRGLVSVAEAHAVPLGENEDGGPISAVARLPATTLHPDVDARSALAIFDAAEADTLAVTERETGLVVGLLGEAFAARRYAQETDQAAKGVLGGG